MVIKITDKIDAEWNKYDAAIGQSHLDNWGIIFLDEFGLPVDNSFELEEMAREAGKLLNVFSEKTIGLGPERLKDCFDSYVSNDYEGSSGEYVLGQLRSVMDDDEIRRLGFDWLFDLE